MRILKRVAKAIRCRVAAALTGVTTDQPVVALTFDDGPDPVSTPRLLNLLAAHGARATFFMVGVCARRHPDLVRRVAAEGHLIGNHSWDHPSFPLISPRERREQIQHCGAAIAPYGQRLFRPPYGALDFMSYVDARRMGHRLVAWSVAAGDWAGRDGPALADAVTADLRPGSVVLFHDGLFDATDERYFGRDATISAVEALLDRFSGRLQFVTILDLLRRGRPRWEYWTFNSGREFLNRLVPRSGPPRRY